MCRCKDCIHWYRFNKSDKVGTCEKVDHFENEDKVVGSGGFAIIIETPDDQGLDYNLQTGPLFGCVLFEERKEVKL